MNIHLLKSFTKYIVETQHAKETYQILHVVVRPLRVDQ